MLDDRSYMRNSEYRSPWSIWLILILVNTSVFAADLIGQIVNRSGMAQLNGYLALSVGGVSHGWIWQLLTFQFLHGGPLHLILNCAMLWMFGRIVEVQLGRISFLRLYLLSGVFGGLLQLLFMKMFPGHFGNAPVIGASAGVFGVIAAFAALNWEESITTFVALIIPVTMKAKFLILIEAIISVLGMLDAQSGVAHAAHLGGIITGLLYIRAWKNADTFTSFWARRQRPSREHQLVNVTKGKSSWRKPARAASEDIPSEEFISREVDPILDKISAQGIHSLTDCERKILEAARRKMAKR